MMYKQSHTLINLSDWPLSSDETTLLSEGGNVATTSKVIATEEIVADIEIANKNFQENRVQDI